MGIKNTINKVFGSAIDIAQDIIAHQVDRQYMIFDKALNIYSYSSVEGCVYTSPDDKDAIYGVQIETDDTTPRIFSYLPMIIEGYGYEDDARLTIFYSKSKMTIDDTFDDFVTKQSVYIFTPLRGIAEEIANFYQKDKMTVTEIQNAFLDIGLFNEYTNNNQTFEVNSDLPKRELINADTMAFKFKTYFAEGVYKALGKTMLNPCSKYEVYQGIGINTRLPEGKPDLIGAMGGDWLGYLSITMMFGQDYVKKEVKEWYKQSKTFDIDQNIKNGYKQFTEEVLEADTSKYMISNIVAVTNNGRAMRVLSDKLNVKFVKKNLFVKDIVYKTPMLQIDGSMSFLAYTADMTKFIQSIHKKHKIKPEKSVREEGKNMYGADIAGNYTTYSFHETGGSPHWSIIAPTRSGKTFFLLKFIQQSIGAEIVRNPEVHSDKKSIVRNCTKLGDVQIVMFDIGSSAIKWIQALKDYAPKQVSFYEEDLENLRFGLTDYRWNEKLQKANEEDIMFAFATMSLLLHLNGEEELIASEKAEIKDAYERIMIEGKFEGKSIRQLREIGGYDVIIEQLKDVYDAGEYEKEFEFLKTTEFRDVPVAIAFVQKPLIKDIITEMNMKRNNTAVTEKEKETCAGAIQKLEIINANPIFAYYSKENIAVTDYFYMELEKIKALGDKVFIPIFMLIFQKLYRRDVENALRLKAQGKTPPKMIYSIEEAHNFTRLPMLKEVLDIILRESARYNISLGFISQKGSDYTSDMLYNIGSRIVMPSEDTGKQGLELKEYWSEDESTESGSTDGQAFFLKRARRFYAFIKNGAGIITIKPPVTKEEEWMFNSNPVEVK